MWNMQQSHNMVAVGVVRVVGVSAATGATTTYTTFTTATSAVDVCLCVEGGMVLGRVVWCGVDGVMWCGRCGVV